MYVNYFLTHIPCAANNLYGILKYTWDWLLLHPLVLDRTMTFKA